MKIIDLHQDLMTHVRFRDTIGQTEQTDFTALEKSEVDLVVATAFPLPPEDDQLHPSAPILISEELALYQAYVAVHPEWRIVKAAADLNASEKKLILHIEGLNHHDGSAAAFNQLDHWHSLGVRSMATHWNIQNSLGGGTLQPTEPLTSLGAEVIRYLEDKRIIFDMAHMGRQSFFDAAALVQRPLYVSHGNAHAVCKNVRNYTDEQLRLIAASDGVIGIFFPNTFVVGRDVHGTIADVIRHIDYVAKLIGTRHIALGSDFGGIVTGCVENLAHVNDFPKLIHALREHHYNETQIAQIAHDNAFRILQTHLVG